MQSPDGNQLWCPGPSLWNLITEHVHGSELPKIRTALGHSLVDMYVEVYNEAEMCHKMWHGSRRGENHGSKTGTNLTCQQGSLLPDPPVVKELVRAEVKMLLQTLKERTRGGGRDGEELLLQYNPKTVNYALSHTYSCYTTCTNCREVDDGSKTENRTRPSSRCSVQSSAEDEIEAVRDKLNVTDIDQVVDCLKSLMSEECEVLKRLVHHLKENINQKYRRKSEFYKSEPTLVELRELREAVQKDLELCSSSVAVSSTFLSPLPVKELKNKFRLSAGQTASDESLQALTAASDLRPLPPTSLCHTNPRPPAGPRLTKMSATVRPFPTFSLSMSCGQQRSISAISKSRKTSLCNKITTSEQANTHITTEQIMVRNEHHHQDSVGLHCRNPKSSPRFLIKTQRNSPVHEAHLSSNPSFQSLRKECDLSPHSERKGSRNMNIILSHEPALSDAGSYSSNGTDHSLSTTGELNTQNGQQIGGVSSVQTDKERIKITPKGFSSLVLSETGSPTSQKYSRKTISVIESGRLGKDVNQQQSLTDCSSHHLESSDEHRQNTCSHPVSIHINRHLSTFPKRPLGGITQRESAQETQTGLENISKFHQLVPPAKVLT